MPERHVSLAAMFPQV